MPEPRNSQFTAENGLFTGPDDSGLPDYVRNLNERQRQDWVSAWNEGYSFCHTNGGSEEDCLDEAFANADVTITDWEARNNAFHETSQTGAGEADEEFAGDDDDGDLDDYHYEGVDDPDLPDHVRALDSDQRQLWVATYNGHLTRVGDETDTDLDQHLQDAATAADQEVADRQAHGQRGDTVESDPGRSESRDLSEKDQSPFFLKRIYQNLKDKVSKDIWDDAVKDARGHAGGKTSARNRKDRKDDPPETDVEKAVANANKNPVPSGLSALAAERRRSFATWSTKYVNDLPDSSFAYIESGGKKDDEGKTTPRSLRHLPYKDKDGKVDAPHCRNALARLNQTKAVPEGQREAIRSKLQKALDSTKQKASAELAAGNDAGEGRQAKDKKQLPQYAPDTQEWKDSKDAGFVNYRRSEDPDTRCGVCEYFHEGGSCDLVAGQIDPQDVCDLFEPQQAQASLFDFWSLLPASERKSGDPHGLFVEVTSLSEAPTTIPYLPKPHVFQHPIYGEISITRKRNMRFVTNFKQRIYQYPLPLDAEHETKLSGAVAWITDLKLNEDGSVDAVVDWTLRGRQLVEGGGFRFVSPEWYDEWTDPATGESYKDVAIGGAITTRPFFKEEYLRPLVATEQGQLIIVDRQFEGVTMTIMDETKDKDKSKEQAPPPAKAAGEDSSKFAERERQLTEQITGLNTQLETLRDEKAAAERKATEVEQQFGETKTQFEQRFTELNAQLSRATGEISRMNSESRRKRFMDEILGRSEGSTVRWFGDIEGHIRMMETLDDLDSKRTPEERQAAEQRQEKALLLQYVETQRGQAEVMKKSPAFKEVGSGADAVNADDPQERLNQIAKQYQEQDPKLSAAAAMDRATTNNPQIYAELVNKQRYGGRALPSN